MKNLIFTLLISLWLVPSAISQKSDSLNYHFMCSVGVLNDSEYPLEIKLFKSTKEYSRLSNGKLVPFFSMLKENIESGGKWFIIEGNDTTKLESIEVKAKKGMSAVFKANGKNFNKSIDTEGYILKMNTSLTLFRDKNNNEWKLIRME